MYSLMTIELKKPTTHATKIRRATYPTDCFSVLMTRRAVIAPAPRAEAVAPSRITCWTSSGLLGEGAH